MFDLVRTLPCKFIVLPLGIAYLFVLYFFIFINLNFRFLIHALKKSLIIILTVIFIIMIPMATLARFIFS